MYKQALFGTVFVHQYNNTALCLDANFSKSKISRRRIAPPFDILDFD